MDTSSSEGLAPLSPSVDYHHNPSPISKIGRDLLWSIFLINADHSDDPPYFRTATYRDPWFPMNHALVVTWRSAQVCRLWRNILLHSPSVWGRNIDLDLLQGPEDRAWADEVLRRSGQSLLHVKGRVVAPGLEFFIFLLDANWKRIWSLELEASMLLDEVDDNEVEKLSRILQRPAPSIHYFSYFAIRPLAVHNALFSGDAPNLRHFESGNLEFNIDHNNLPWLSQLRTLRLRNPHRKSLSLVLDALRQMSFLESLLLFAALQVQDHSKFYQPSSTQEYGVFEPESVNVQANLALLRHILPSPGCSLNLSLVLNAPLDENEEAILTAFAGVKRLKFILGNDQLETTEYTLEWIFAVSKAPTIMPQLQKVVLDEISSYEDLEQEQGPSPSQQNRTNNRSLKFILEFLSSYREAGKAIKVLDLTRITRDMRFLDEVEGLQVLWTHEALVDERVTLFTESYICGSGSPEVLNFNALYSS
ncbi:LOW QUALITY PROTEIN: hypothetical protein CVT26_004016 [Gymnopilus dilepis]|uniref:F-box domain-containing protein n=1 Tax=Gymnopilus dilepis TaxID=231916 RepID=A0A409W247_9AGAR|nr:LOW QUALITY PROTEIN: hypothetical protein CVT26_004016 [Gymnopilus dilepis]